MSGKFFAALRELRSGSTLEELDSAISEVVAAVKTVGKVGEVTLKLKIRPGRGAKYLSIVDEVITKVPEVDHPDTIFFPLADNSLTRTDPDQLQLGLRSVPDQRPAFDPESGVIHSA